MKNPKKLEVSNKKYYIQIQHFYFGRKIKIFGNVFIPSKGQWAIGLIWGLSKLLHEKKVSEKKMFFLIFPEGF